MRRCSWSPGRSFAYTSWGLFLPLVHSRFRITLRIWQASIRPGAAGQLLCRISATQSPRRRSSPKRPSAGTRWCHRQQLRPSHHRLAGGRCTRSTTPLLKPTEVPSFHNGSNGRSRIISTILISRGTHPASSRGCEGLPCCTSEQISH